MHLNSRVPTAADGNSGVKTKWFRGETMQASNLAGSRLRAKLKPPHPEPKITTRFLAFINDDDIFICLSKSKFFKILKDIIIIYKKKSFENNFR